MLVILTQKVLIIAHEFVDLRLGPHDVVFENAGIGLVTLARAMQILAREVARRMREETRVTTMAIIGEEKLAQVSLLI